MPVYLLLKVGSIVAVIINSHEGNSDSASGFCSPSSTLSQRNFILPLSALPQQNIILPLVPAPHTLAAFVRRLLRCHLRTFVARKAELGPGVLRLAEVFLRFAASTENTASLDRACASSSAGSDSLFRLLCCACTVTLRQSQGLCKQTRLQSLHTPSRCAFSWWRSIRKCMAPQNCSMTIALVLDRLKPGHRN